MVLFPQSPIRYDKFDSISLSMANASIGVNGAYSLAGELLCVNMSLVGLMSYEEIIKPLLSNR